MSAAFASLLLFLFLLLLLLLFLFFFFMRQLQPLSRKKLEQALEGLFHLDWGLKSGRAEGAIDLEKWVVQTVG